MGVLSQEKELKTQKPVTAKSISEMSRLFDESEILVKSSKPTFAAKRQGRNQSKVLKKSPERAPLPYNIPLTCERNSFKDGRPLFCVIIHHPYVRNAKRK